MATRFRASSWWWPERNEDTTHDQSAGARTSGAGEAAFPGKAASPAPEVRAPADWSCVVSSFRSGHHHELARNRVAIADPVSLDRCKILRVGLRLHWPCEAAVG